MKSKQIKRILVRLTCFQRLKGVILLADFQYDILNNPFEARSVEHERIKIAKWFVCESDPSRSDRDRMPRIIFTISRKQTLIRFVILTNKLPVTKYVCYYFLCNCHVPLVAQMKLGSLFSCKYR